MAPEIPHDQPSIESPLSGERLDVLASQVAASIQDDQRTCHLTTSYLPSRREVIGVLERMSWLLFPGFHGPREIDSKQLQSHTRQLLSGIAGPLFHQIAGALRYAETTGSITFSEHCPDCDERAREIVDSFLESIPALRARLSLMYKRHTTETPLLTIQTKPFFVIQVFERCGCIALHMSYIHFMCHLFLGLSQNMRMS
jgi:hypothetical protein